MSKKHPLFGVNLMPPQPSASMVDGFVLTLLLGECFEILSTIVSISSGSAPQSLDHISQLMVSNQTADWTSNKTPEKRRGSVDLSATVRTEFSTIFHTLSDEETKFGKASLVLKFIYDIL